VEVVGFVVQEQVLLHRILGGGECIGVLPAALEGLVQELDVVGMRVDPEPLVTVLDFMRERERAVAIADAC